MPSVRACGLLLGLAGSALWSGAPGQALRADPPPAPPAAAPETPPGAKKLQLAFPASGRGIDQQGMGSLQLKEGLPYRTDRDGKLVFFYTTQFVKPIELIASAKQMNLPWIDDAHPGIGVVFTPLQEQNQILLQGDEDDVIMAVQAMDYLDVPAPQVFVEAKVVEITWDSNFEFGIESLLKNAPGGAILQGLQGNLNPTSYLASTLPGGLPFLGTSLTLGAVGANALDFGAFTATFRALHESGKAEVLSNPSIICTQGKEASVVTKETFNVNQLKRADRNNENYETAPANTGVNLKVTALHVGSGSVTINLTATVDGVAGFASRIGGTLSPITTTRTASTIVTLYDGQVLVIGGLYTNRTVKEEAKTPLLSDVPIVGTLFTRQRESKQKSELVFLLTPKIIRKGASLQVVTPPAELNRLEKSEGLIEPDCGPCKPSPRMQDLLFPREAACRDLTQRQAAKATAPGPLPPPVVRSGACRGSDDPPAAPAR